MKLDGIGEGVRKVNPHLFRCPVGRLSDAENERSLHNQIFEECRRRGWIALHGSMAERTHRTEGEADFTILADRGRTFFIECKTRSGKLSPAQAAHAHHAAKLGHTIHLVRSFPEFCAIVDR